MACIALMLARPCPKQTVTKAKWDALFERCSRSESLASARGAAADIFLKATVVFVPAPLLGQWQDELRKYAPSLKVLVFHSSLALADDRCRRVIDADVILTTPQTHLDVLTMPRVRPFRMIVDEIHAASGWGKLTTYKPCHTWLITGTPLTRHVNELKFGASLLGLRLDGYSPSLELVELLRTVMIRHTPAMRIHGEDALSLPEKDTETVLLDMSAQELRFCRMAILSDESRGLIKERRVRGGTVSAVELALKKQREACSLAIPPCAGRGKLYRFSGNTIGTAPERNKRFAYKYLGSGGIHERGTFIGERPCDEHGDPGEELGDMVGVRLCVSNLIRCSFCSEPEQSDTSIAWPFCLNLPCPFHPSRQSFRVTLPHKTLVPHGLACRRDVVRRVHAIFLARKRIVHLLHTSEMANRASTTTTGRVDR